MSSIDKYLPFAQEACKYLSDSPDPFFAVLNNVEKLEAAGYSRLSKREPFSGKIKAGGKYFYTVNKTALVAFAVGPNYKPGNGFKIIGGHTDSPNLKVKPISKRKSCGYTQLNVECYGGGLWHTWFDRDLGISGRVFVREGDQIVQKVVKITRPIARVSTLCIHLQSAEERRGFSVNKENHICPVVGTDKILEEKVTEQLVGGDNSSEEENKEDPWNKAQEPCLMRLLAKELDTNTESILNFELNLFDTQAASIGGIESEFLNSARLDNLATCFVSIEALLAHTSSETFSSQDEDISMVCLFDHEEVGSTSSAGAGSPLTIEAIRRISAAMNSGEIHPDFHAMAIRKSLILSVDQAHAIHPNYSSKHESQHSPKMNHGVVIKSNQNQRYTTNSVTSLILREISRCENLTPLQEFVVRNDCPCGSTIGPTLSALTGIRTIDVGMPQLSMHSCREVMGVQDLTHGYELFKAFFKHFTDVDSKLEG